MPLHLGRSLPNRYSPLLPLLILFLGISGFASGAASTALAGSERRGEKLRELKDEVQTLRVELDFLNQKVTDSRKGIRSLETKIETQQNKVMDLENQVLALASQTIQVTGQIEVQQAEVIRCQQNYQDVIDRFRRKLVQLHKIKQGSLLTSVLAAGDVNTFLSRYQMMRHLLLQDRSILEEIKRVRLELENAGGQLRRKQEELAQLSLTASKSRENMLWESSSLAAMLKTLVMERKILVHRQSSVQGELSGIEKEIAAIEKARTIDPVKFERELEVETVTPQIRVTTRPVERSTPPPVRRPTLPPNEPIPAAREPVPPKPSVAATVQKDSGEIPAGKTRFIWPLAQFKPPLASRESSAESIAIPPDGTADVMAMATGKVLFKGPMGSLGHVVILGHRHNFTTVYGRLHNIWVGLGQVVQQGEVLGKLIDPNDSLLHIEVRLAGKLQDPRKYLPEAK
jgi:septal ring factor EnvC (AmiA/AmiB activator)